LTVTVRVKTMMRFVLCLAVAVCSAVHAAEVPYVSGQVEFAPTSNTASEPFYWNLGGGEGLIVGGGDYVDVQQDGWRIELYDRAGGDLGCVSAHWLTSGIRVSSNSGALGSMRALFDVPFTRRRTYLRVNYEYDGTPALVWINGKRLTLPAKTWPGNCGGEVFGGYSGTFRTRVYATDWAEVIVWPMAGGGDFVISNVTFE